MNREEIINQIVETPKYGYRRIKEDYLKELDKMAADEGCEWGENVNNIIDLYRVLQRDYCSDKFSEAIHNEIVDSYIFMTENTEFVEYPEREEVVKYPAKKVREWVY